MKFLITHALFLLAITSFTGCVQPPASDESAKLGISSSENNGEFNDSKILKIIVFSSENLFKDHTMNVTDSVQMRAGLFDVGGEFLELAQASWSISTNGFQNSDLVAASDSKSATFTPTNVGTAKITAVYSGDDTKVISTTDSTGDISVTHIQTPHAMSITGGDNQSAIVNNNLSNPLEVQVTDLYGIAVQGIEVNFSVTAGSGAILGLSNVFTDANGKASASAKLGTLVGSSNNTYRAQVVSDTSISVDFSANAIAGPAAMLTFTNSPGISYAGVDFNTVPTVQLRDQYSNPVALNGASVTLSVGTGSGNLTGTLTSTTSNGVASFPGTSYDTIDSGVVLSASYGAITGNSLSFDVLGTPPGACVNEVPGVFITANGGCHDVASGLTWSKGSNTKMPYYDFVWDETLPGASPADEHDYGRTNDYNPVSGCPNNYHCDNNDSANLSPSMTGYCHDMVQGGYEDWRAPTLSELVNAVGNQNATGATPIINFHSTFYHLTSDSYTTGNFQAVLVSTGGTAGVSNTSTYAFAICVRGKRTDLTQMGVIQKPTEMRYGQLPSTSLKIQLQQANGVGGTAQGVPITLSAISSGTLNGTTTVNTDNKGVATFDNFTITDALPGTNTITITSPDYPDASVDIDFFFKQKCILDDGITFTNSDGGCLLIGQNLVWSARSVTPMFWELAVHQSEIDGSPAPADPDTSINYCYDLNESGYSDWRSPTIVEMQQLSVADAQNLEGLTPHLSTWSATAASATAVYGITNSWGTVFSRELSSNNSYYMICVREP